MEQKEPRQQRAGNSLFLTLERIGGHPREGDISISIWQSADDQDQINSAEKEGKLMNQSRKIKILLAKPGLDGHDRGVKVLAYGLRDAGFEVVYTGLRQTPEMIVNAAVQEDVDVVGLSILSGAHLSLTQRVIQNLREKGVAEKVVLVGGIIPPPDIAKLKEMGVAEVFIPGASIKNIADFIKRKCAG